MDDELSNGRVMSEIVHMVVGEKIGEGAYRKVYRSLASPHEVIKIESESRRFSNVKEWEVWQHFQYDDTMSKWFAPCMAVSPSGIILVQKRTQPVATRDLPKMVPGLLTDLKRENWGWLDDRVVCHDYGNILFHGGTKLKKAPWGDDMKGYQ